MTMAPLSALFAHDHRFIPAEGEVWSESQFEAALWSRYLAHFQRLTVAGRAAEVPPGKTAADLERSSRSRVAFALFANLSSARGLVRERGPAARRMRALVTEHDAVIARLPSEIGLLAVAAARRQGKPWAVEVAGCPWDGLWHYGSLAGRLYAPVAWRRMRRALAAADHAIYVTRAFLQTRYPTHAANLAWASNVVLPEVPETALTRRLASIAEVHERTLRLGLIGSLRHRYKGVHTLLAALGDVRDRLPPFELRILGNGDPAPWQAEARRRGVGDLVSFDGTLPAGEPVLAWLDEVDVYLQPSLQEGLPRALVEAMSRACPALGSTVAGIPELVPREDLVRPGDANQLAALLAERLVDRAWMETSARRNWRTASAYRADVLNARRGEFWQTFANEILAKGVRRDEAPFE